MGPEPCKVQGCPALDVVRGGMRNERQENSKYSKSLAF
jgi:hypothetical protein